MKKIMFLMALALVLFNGGCAPDPRIQAEADAARSQAEQQALDRAQARAQADAKFALEQAQREAISVSWVEAINQFIKWAGYALTVAVCMALISIGGGTGIAAYGLGRATAQLAMLRANLIAMDPRTRSYPLLQYRGSGKYLVINPNVGEALPLDTRNAPDRQMITAFFGQQLAIGVAEQARLHERSPDGVAMVGLEPALVGMVETRPDGTQLQVGAALDLIGNQVAKGGNRDV